jgi:broad specificity phosphatase PhoE
MRALVVRHYKTLLNASDRILGWGDAPRAEGWRADLDFVLEVMRDRSITFDAIYCSNLERARQTARFYARSSGIHILNDSCALNEVNYGLLYRKSKKWVAANIPEHKKDPDYVYPEGESFSQMQRRSVDFVDSLAGRYSDQTILIVVHAGVIRGLVSHYLDLDYAANLKQKISHRYIGDFYFENGVFSSYRELGKPSGFVNDGLADLAAEPTGRAVVSGDGSESGLSGFAL